MGRFITEQVRKGDNAFSMEVINIDMIVSYSGIVNDNREETCLSMSDGKSKVITKSVSDFASDLKDESLITII